MMADPGRGRARALAYLIVLGTLRIAAQPPKSKLGDTSSGSRAEPAHIIALRDQEGDSIQPGDRHALPFSVTQTCGGACHDVAAISHGWHFNAAIAGVPPGRSGQPWLWTDRETASTIPLSYRAWPGTYKPRQFGLSDREFALRFGGRTAGGIGPENDTGARDRTRWRASGALEVNCLVCHDASPAYDQADYASQVAQENFRYAPASASGLALVTGSAREMPDIFDYLLPNSVEDSLQAKVPRVQYAPARFLPSGKVAFDIVRDVKSSRCYYCHTDTDVEFTGAARWKSHQDIHLARGLTCETCHRNGLDHMTVRGYDDASLSCQGCHEKGNPTGAPHPEHAGIPPVHFAKMTCTACHSGALPEANTRRLKNSMTHGLGEFNVDPSPDAPPHLYYPVFARQQDGKLAPNRAVWPSFWGRLRGGPVTPIPAAEVKTALAKGKLRTPADIDQRWVEQVLGVLGQDAVYISGGKLHRLASGKLLAEDHSQAEPYLWPIGHDVRPAAQALGAKGCQECHSTNAAIFFGNVTVDSPVAAQRTTWKMNRFEGNLDTNYQARLAGTWQYRGWLKVIGLTAAAVLLLVLLAYALKAVEWLSAALIRKRQ